MANQRGEMAYAWRGREASNMGQTVTIITAIVGTLTAIALATISIFQVRETRRQVAISQQQVRESIEARYDEMLPVLIPNLGLGGFQGLTPPYSYEDSEGKEVTTEGYSDVIMLKNVGAGTAFNISFLVFAVLHPKSGGTKHSKGAIIHIPEPLAPGTPTALYNLSKITAIPHTATLHDPLTQVAFMICPSAEAPSAALRATCTYTDLYGRKHACIYEFVHNWEERNRDTWVFICALHNIKQDLRDLDHLYTEKQ